MKEVENDTSTNRPHLSNRMSDLHRLVCHIFCRSTHLHFKVSNISTNTHKIGYVRVSSNDQNLDLQRNALTKAGCQVIYEEKISGKVPNALSYRIV